MPTPIPAIVFGFPKERSEWQHKDEREENLVWALKEADAGMYELDHGFENAPHMNKGTIVAGPFGLTTGPLFGIVSYRPF